MDDAAIGEAVLLDDVLHELKLCCIYVFLNDNGWRTFVHHSGMVRADELTFNTTACSAVNDIPIDLSVSINDTSLTRKILILGMDMKGVWLHFFST